MKHLSNKLPEKKTENAYSQQVAAAGCFSETSQNSGVTDPTTTCGTILTTTHFAKK